MFCESNKRQWSVYYQSMLCLHGQTDSNAEHDSRRVPRTILNPDGRKDKPEAASHYPARLLKCIMRPRICSSSDSVPVRNLMLRR